MVTFDTGFSIRLSNQVPRTVRLGTGSTFTPTSPPTRRSGPSSALASVNVWPTLNWRYSSLSVGARKPQPRLLQTFTWSVTRYIAATRGLPTVSLFSARFGLLFAVGAPEGCEVSRLWAL